MECPLCSRSSAVVYILTHCLFVTQALQFRHKYWRIHIFRVYWLFLSPDYLSVTSLLFKREEQTENSMLHLMIASLLFSSLSIMDEEAKFWIDFATWPVWWTVSQFSSAQATN